MTATQDPAHATPWPTSRARAAASTDRQVGGWKLVLAEAAAGVAAAVVSVALSLSIIVDPLDRVGQVSGIAALALRYCVLGLGVLAVVLVAAARARGTAAFDVVTRLACAAVAGLVTGFIAGGLVVALRGSSWPLFADSGDAGQLALWADLVRNGGSMPGSYPPLAIHAMAWMGELTGRTSSQALKAMQVLGAALYGPIAYLAWRLVLSPPWALGLGLIAALPLIDLYKPYANVVLIVLLPVLVVYLRRLRLVGSASRREIVITAAGFGAVFGVLFLTYSGWFVWSALGASAAALIVFPWRRGARRGLLLLALTAFVFCAVTLPYLIDLIRAAGTVQDRFFYFDTQTEPAYIAMWRNDTPGDIGPWPPPGELAGVGLFSVLLVLGLSAALALARQRTVVITLSCCMAGAWLIRFWLASQSYTTQTVQLYPRTTPEILYCLLLLSGFAVYFATRLLLRPPDPTDDPPPGGRARPGTPSASATVGVVSAVLLLGLFAASAVSDRYMPRADTSAGILAYVAHFVRQHDGSCPIYTRPDDCLPNAAVVIERHVTDD